MMNRKSAMIIFCLTAFVMGGIINACTDTEYFYPTPDKDSGFDPYLELVNCDTPSGPSLVLGPYISDITSSGATLMFKSSGESDSKVYFLEYDDGCLAADVFEHGTAVSTDKIDQSIVPYSKAGDPIPENLYAAHFSLESDTDKDRRYCYGIEFPPTPWQSNNTYFCPPSLSEGLAGTSFVVPADKGNEFALYIYGDQRDPMGFNLIHDRVVAMMSTDFADDLMAGNTLAELAFNVGDFGYTGCQIELWEDNYFSPNRAFLQHLPIFASPGDHEYFDTTGGPSCTNASFYFSFFGMAYNNNTSMAPGMYAVDYKNVRIISLNMISHTDKGGLDPAECKGGESCEDTEICGYKWLQCRLTEADTDDSIDQIFMFYHAPLLTAPSTGKHPSSKFQIQYLAPLFERPDGQQWGKVTAVIQGHNHFYERSGPISALCLKDDGDCIEEFQSTCPDTPTPAGFDFPPVCYNEDPVNGITYILVGGGGATLYEAAPGPFPIQWLEQAASVYQYGKINVSGKKATLEVVGFDKAGKPYKDSAVLR